MYWFGETADEAAVGFKGDSDGNSPLTVQNVQSSVGKLAVRTRR